MLRAIKMKIYISDVIFCSDNDKCIKLMNEEREEYYFLRKNNRNERKAYNELCFFG